MYHLAFDDLLGSHLLLSIWSISRLFTPSPTEVVSLSNRSTIFRKELGKVCRGGANYIMPNQSLHSAKHLSWQLCHSEVLSRMESEFCFMISISLLAPVKGQTWRPAALTDTLLTLTEAMFPLWLPILSAAGMHSYCLLSLKLWAEHLDINSALDTRADFAQSMVGPQQVREDAPSACESSTGQGRCPISLWDLLSPFSWHKFPSFSSFFTLYVFEVSKGFESLLPVCGSKSELLF